MNYRYVFWDWNGTLLDDTRASFEAVNISLRKRGLKEVDERVYAEKFCFPVIEYYKALGFDLRKESYESLAVEFIENYLAVESGLRHGARRTLEKLYLNSVEQFILSASEKGILEGAVKKFGIERYFRDIIALDNINAESKIDAGRKYLSEHPPEGRALMVGDTEHDAETAAELGFDCVLIESGNNSRGRLERTGARIIDSLSDLPKIVLGKQARRTDYMTPERSERRSFDLGEVNRRFKENYRSFYNDVKNTNATEDW